MDDAAAECKKLLDAVVATYLALHQLAETVEQNRVLGTHATEKAHRINRQRMDGLVLDWLADQRTPGTMGSHEAALRVARMLAEDFLRRADEAIAQHTEGEEVGPAAQDDSAPADRANQSDQEDGEGDVPGF